MTNFDKFGQKYCNTCKYDYYTDVSNVCNNTTECYKCPNYSSISNEKDYIGCRCLEEATVDADACPYYEENGR